MHPRFLQALLKLTVAASAWRTSGKEIKCAVQHSAEICAVPKEALSVVAPHNLRILADMKPSMYNAAFTETDPSHWFDQDQICTA
jgi:hypothetical protein